MRVATVTCTLGGVGDPPIAVPNRRVAPRLHNRVTRRSAASTRSRALRSCRATSSRRTAHCDPSKQSRVSLMQDWLAELRRQQEEAEDDR